MRRMQKVIYGKFSPVSFYSFSTSGNPLQTSFFSHSFDYSLFIPPFSQTKTDLDLKFVLLLPSRWILDKSLNLTEHSFLGFLICRPGKTISISQGFSMSAKIDVSESRHSVLGKPVGTILFIHPSIPLIIYWSFRIKREEGPGNSLC